ncbi:MAG: hypothetical protein KME43_20655 [Myxacorys chilensis ATA2-1-KO14]|nr:hypothetical protein [Myxacorys chilensis ATA2-1-KO14]
MVEQIELLPQLFSSVVIPDAVFQELLANGVEHPVAQTVQVSRNQISPPASRNL